MNLELYKLGRGNLYWLFSQVEQCNENFKFQNAFPLVPLHPHLSSVAPYIPSQKSSCSFPRNSCSVAWLTLTDFIECLLSFSSHCLLLESYPSLRFTQNIILFPYSFLSLSLFLGAISLAFLFSKLYSQFSHVAFHMHTLFLYQYN